jgi:hypothetical protein
MVTFVMCSKSTFNLDFHLIKVFKKLSNNLLEKLVLFLSVRHVVACHAITVTKHCFTWCSEVMWFLIQWNLYPSFLKGPWIINNEWGKTILAGKLLISNYMGRIVRNLPLQDRFFVWITNYQGFWNNQLSLYEFFLLET